MSRFMATKNAKHAVQLRVPTHLASFAMRHAKSMGLTLNGYVCLLISRDMQDKQEKILDKEPRHALSTMRG